ncbi:hypothetical protein TorRG33x02_293020 [Trema orientale]|uniref:Uncharacterized protein n=1 Tax=Trema orientale TaxID=63057 RepID=A0A2P5C9Q0_TREOI|nr:hypothetical protein TorRG33x02_293020 [Trema orientale]
MINVSDQIVDIPYNRVNVRVSLFPPNMPPDCTPGLTLIRLGLCPPFSLIPNPVLRFTANPLSSI